MSEASGARELRLNFHGRIIDHLGIQMYQSPVAAVAEIVSNAWDAEAETVDITLPDQLTDGAVIVVSDDGLGMTFEQCQARYLKVGYDRRAGNPRAKSPNKGRPVLGRKGIGKFAGFGIATVIRVETISGETGEKIVFELDADRLRGDEYVERDSKKIDVLEYLPPDEARKEQHGTVIRLSKLTVGQRPSPQVFGRSMARRFLLHQRTADFRVSVNSRPLPGSEDLEKIQFVFPRDYHEDKQPDNLTVDEDGWGVEEVEAGRTIRWRFVFYQDPIDDEELRGIAIFARGKLAQSPFLFNLVGGLGGQQGIEYLSGALEATYLDEQNSDLIAPERQRLDWNRSETIPLLQWGQRRVRSLLRVWQERRAENKYRLLTEKMAPLAERLGKLPRHERTIIERALRGLAGITSIKEQTFLELGHSLLTAWEGGRLRELISAVADADQLSGDEFLTLLMEAEVLTALHTAEAVRAKMLIIDGLRERIARRELELAVPDYIAENPWLISPKWETFQIERSVANVITEAAQETQIDRDDDWRGRIDLVLSSGDSLLILEFMKPGLNINFDHISRFQFYVIAVRTRIEALTGGQFRRVVGGYLVADRLQRTTTIAAQLTSMEQAGMYAMDWETLLRQAEAQWKEFSTILASRAPDDARVQALSQEVEREDDVGNPLAD